MERWTGLWALGAVLLVAGAVLLFVPVVPDGPHSVTAPGVVNGRPVGYFLVENISGYSISGMVPVSVSWGSSVALYMSVAICSDHDYNLTREETFGNASGCGPLYSGPASGATSWTDSESVPTDGSMVIVFGLVQVGLHTVNMTYTITYTIWTGLTLASTALFAAGLVSVALGVFFFMRALKPENPASKSR